MATRHEGSGTGGRSFEEFFEETYPRLGRAAFLITGDMQDAQEVAQEAMVRTYERWDRVSSMSSPEGYAFRVAMNLCRRRARLAHRARQESGNVSEVAQDHSAGSDARIDVMWALRRLSVGERTALVAVHFLGLDAHEAADLLGLRPGSLRSRLHRARASMGRSLGAGYGRDG